MLACQDQVVLRAGEKYLITTRGGAAVRVRLKLKIWIQDSGEKLCFFWSIHIFPKFKFEWRREEGETII